MNRAPEREQQDTCPEDLVRHREQAGQADHHEQHMCGEPSHGAAIRDLVGSGRWVHRHALGGRGPEVGEERHQQVPQGGERDRSLHAKEGDPYESARQRSADGPEQVGRVEHAQVPTEARGIPRHDLEQRGQRAPHHDGGRAEQEEPGADPEERQEQRLLTQRLGETHVRWRHATDHHRKREGVERQCPPRAGHTASSAPDGGRPRRR